MSSTPHLINKILILIRLESMMGVYLFKQEIVDHGEITQLIGKKKITETGSAK